MLIAEEQRIGHVFAQQQGVHTTDVDAFRNYRGAGQAWIRWATDL